MNIDMRRFSYRLNAVHTKAEWSLDAERVRLAAARLALEECDQDIASAKEERDGTIAAMQAMQRTHIDPHGHGAALGFLLSLDIRIEQLRQTRAQRQRDLEHLQASCTALQSRVEQLDAYRRDQKGAFMMAEQARAQVASDADWLQRAGWLRLVGDEP
ncbi:MAG: hypothetical protein QM639_02110 [Rhodocyclaceae bacterium]